MTFHKMQDMLQARADLLFAGRFEEMARHILFPLPVYLQASPVVISCASHLSLVLGPVREVLISRGVLRCIPTVQAVEITRRGRFRVWARWEERAADPAQSSRTEVVNYFRDTGTGILSEMLEYLDEGQAAALSLTGGQRRIA